MVSFWVILRNVHKQAYAIGKIPLPDVEDALRVHTTNAVDRYGATLPDHGTDPEYSLGHVKLPSCYSFSTLNYISRQMTSLQPQSPYMPNGDVADAATTTMN